MTLFGGNRSVKVTLDAEIRGYVGKLATAKKSTLDLARAAQESAGKHRRAMDELGTAAAGVGVVLGVAAAGAVASFAQFDKAMSRAAAGTDATASQMTRLRQAALDAGRDTHYSATEAADAITAMGKAGVQVGDILSGGLKGALDLAAAGELAVKDAAEIAATAMTQFGLSGKDLPHVADLLAAGAGKAQGDVTDLANALKYVGPVAHGMGVSIEATTGILAEFASQGIIGEQAGTSLRGVLLALTSPSKTASAEIKRLGITLYDSQGRFLGMENAAGQLQQALSGMSAQQRDASLGVLFGNEQVTAARVLYSGGAKAVADWTAKVNDSGFAARQAATLMNNLSGDVEQLQGSLETAFISSGSGANEGLRELTQGATSVVNAFTALPDPLQRSTVMILGVTAGAALLTAAAIKGAVAVKGMRTNLDELGLSAGKARSSMILLGKGIAAASALTLLPDTYRAVGDWLGNTGSDVSKMSVELQAFARGNALAGDAAKVFGSNLEGLDRSASTLYSGFQDLKGSINDLTSEHWWNRDLPGLPSNEATQIKRLGQALAELANSGHADDAAAAFDRLAKNAGLSREEADKLLQLMPEYAETINKARLATDGAATATSQDTIESLKAAKATQELDEAKKQLKESLDAAANAFLTAREAESGYFAALDEATEAAKTNGRTLDVHTEKGRANRDALDDQAAAALAYLDTLTDASGAPTAAFSGALAKTRAELIQSGIRLGMTKAAAEKYADQILDIPEHRATDIKLTGIAAAQTALDGFIDRLAYVNGRVVTVRVNATAGNVREDRTITRANGGITRYAAGGIEQHVAQIAPAGAYRLWAEPETGGEAYIPLAPSKRARSKEILKEVARVLGMTAYADGGTTSTKPDISAFTPYSLADVARRYESSLLKPISAKELAAATNARKNAALAEQKAERDLVAIRGKAKHTAAQVQDAEDRLDKARRAAITARATEQQAIARANAPQGFNLAAYTTTLRQTARSAEAYRRNLTVIGKRGGDQLVSLLEGMGSEGAALAAALAGAGKGQFTTVVSLLKRLNPEAFASAAKAPTAATGAGITTVRFAAGGIEDHSAQYASRYRLWAEPETGGEAYIPLAAAKRGRSRMLAADVVNRLGGSVSWSTARARSTSAAAGTASTITHGNGPLLQVGKVELVRGTPDQVADEFLFKYRALGG